MVRKWWPTLPELNFANIMGPKIKTTEARLEYNGVLFSPHLLGPPHVWLSYNRRANTWNQLELEDPLGRRECAAMTATLDGKLYIVGGYNKNLNPTNRVSMCNLETHKWRIGSSMQDPRFECAFVAMSDGRLLAAGGLNASFQYLTSAEIYDPKTNQWNYIQPMLKYRRCAAAAVLDDIVYVAGGFRFNFQDPELQPGRESFNTIEAYNVKTNSWSLLPSMRKRRHGFQLIAANGQLFALGGKDGYQDLRECEKFCISSQRWYDIPDMKNAWAARAAVSVDSKIMMLSLIGEISIFDLKTEQWSQLPFEFSILDLGAKLMYFPGINISHPEVHQPQLKDLPNQAKIV